MRRVLLGGIWGGCWRPKRPCSPSYCQDGSEEACACNLSCLHKISEFPYTVPQRSGPASLPVALLLNEGLGVARASAAKPELLAAILTEVFRSSSLPSPHIPAIRTRSDLRVVFEPSDCKWKLSRGSRKSFPETASSGKDNDRMRFFMAIKLARVFASPGCAPGAHAAAHARRGGRGRLLRCTWRGRFDNRRG